MVCSICNHPRRAEIEQACLLKDFGGESRSLSDIANEFKVNLRDLQVHVLTHIPLAESNAKDVEENESIASNIHKREADILRQVMEDSYVTFKNLSSKINTIVSAHTIDSPTMGQLTKPVTDLYLGTSQSIRDTAEKLIRMDQAINGEKDQGLQQVAALVNAIRGS